MQLKIRDKQNKLFFSIWHLLSYICQVFVSYRCDRLYKPTGCQNSLYLYFSYNHNEKEASQIAFFFRCALKFLITYEMFKQTKKCLTKRGDFFSSFKLLIQLKFLTHTPSFTHFTTCLRHLTWDRTKCNLRSLSPAVTKRRHSGTETCLQQEGVCRGGQQEHRDQRCLGETADKSKGKWRSVNPRGEMEKSRVWWTLSGTHRNTRIP